MDQEIGSTGSRSIYSDADAVLVCHGKGKAECKSKAVELYLRPYVHLSHKLCDLMSVRMRSQIQHRNELSLKGA